MVSGDCGTMRGEATCRVLQGLHAFVFQLCDVVQLLWALKFACLLNIFFVMSNIVQVISLGIPMKARMIHSHSGNTTPIPYGKKGQVWIPPVFFYSQTSLWKDRCSEQYSWVIFQVRIYLFFVLKKWPVVHISQPNVWWLNGPSRSPGGIIHCVVFWGKTRCHFTPTHSACKWVAANVVRATCQNAGMEGGGS